MLSKTIIKRTVENRPYASSFSLGALGSLAFSPVGFFPVLFIIFPLLFNLINNTQKPKQAFAISWLFGFGLCLLSLYWVAFALHVSWHDYKWLIPLAVGGLPFLFAFFYGLGGLFFHFLSARFYQASIAARLFLFAAIFSMAEYARGTFFTGFPWNFIAHSWADYPIMLQTLSLWGIYGLSLITILLALLPVLGRKAMLVCMVSLFALALFGYGRITTNPTQYTDQLLLVVQPNIPQIEKWNPALKRGHIEHFADYAGMGGDAPKIVILPETAIAYALDNDSPIFDYVTRDMNQGDILLTGALRVDQEERYFNSLFVVDHNGNVIESYDKHHLVPFGEYMPFRQWLGILPIAAQMVDFHFGTGAKTISIGNISLSPLICYEVIFSGRVVANGNNSENKKRPDMLVNITNDAWYLNSIGPYQHLAISRFRSVEEGIPLVRSANTGISAIFDSVGRMTAKAPLNEDGILYRVLPKALEQPTFFAIYGHRTYGIMLILFFALFGVSAYKKSRKS